ncbi:protein phosphatase 2C domain-containing protein [Candidatus Sumerlaeota bacterium]|nr:protein phosphatase 2C domain-containing protein [Candidatus Sumerlaeota bacterium]
MRTPPTQEQKDYLALIGAFSVCPIQPVIKKDGLTVMSDATSAHSGRRIFLKCVIAIIVMILTLFLVQRAFPVELQLVDHDVTTTGVPTLSQATSETMQRINALEAEILKLREAVGNRAIQDQVDKAQDQIKELELNMEEVRDALGKAIVRDREQAAARLQIIESRLDQLTTSNTLLATPVEQHFDNAKPLMNFTADKSDAQVINSEGVDGGMADRDVAVLYEDLIRLQKKFGAAQLGLWAIVIMGFSYLMARRMEAGKRNGQIEQGIFCSDESCVIDDESLMTPLVTDVDMDAVHNQDQDQEITIKIEPTRQEPPPPPSPDEQMQMMIESASKTSRFRIKPRLPAKSWEIGLATSKGNVKAENQDYGLCFQIDRYNVLIIADGCGGVPHGRRASYLAAMSAANSIIRAYGMSRRRAPHAEDAAAEAISDAAHQLMMEGEKLNITSLRGGLRTTLIVVIRNQHEVGYAYIGDGGGYIVKASGEVRRFLEPQKADAFTVNVLAASLGPKMEGEPVTGSVKCETSDLLVAGTDGVFDRVPPTFPKDVLRGCIQRNGDFQKTAEHIVMELAAYKDNIGYICDDNLTLGIMGYGASPRLTQGFWQVQEKAKANNVSLPSLETVV